MAVLDAYGRNVEELGTCARCGASIKYIYEFEGQTYGSTCIEAVSGIRPEAWVWNNGRADYEATKIDLARREAERLEFIYNNQVLEEQRKQIREANKVKFGELLVVLHNASRYSGDFCSSIVEQIGRDGSTDELCEILSDNQYQIVREIWGKQTGGRMNSKKYNEAVDKFDHKFGW